MQVLERCNRVLWVAQIPNVEARVLIIVVCYNKLGRHKRIPNDLSFFHVNSRRLGWLVVEIVVLI